MAENSSSASEDLEDTLYPNAYNEAEGVRFVVIDELALAHVFDATPHTAWLDRVSIEASIAHFPSASPLSNSIGLTNNHALRPATLADFKRFRVSANGQLYPFRSNLDAVVDCTCDIAKQAPETEPAETDKPRPSRQR